MKKEIKLVAVQLMLIVPAIAQNFKVAYTIKGELKGAKTPNGYVYLKGKLGENIKEDSVKLQDNKFEYKGIAEPTLITVYTKRVNVARYINPIDLFIDKGVINLSAEYDTTEYTFYKNVKISGSKAHQDFQAFQNGRDAINKKFKVDELRQRYDEASNKKDKVELARLEEEYNKIIPEYQKFTDSFIQSHNKSFVSLFIISENLRMANEAKQLKWVDDHLIMIDPSLNTSITMQKMKEKRAFLERGQLIGKLAPDFSQPKADGSLVKLSDFKGKYVLLDFWASWCGPCRAENPNVLKAYNKYKDKGFDIIAVSIDNNAEKWKKAVIDDKLPWTQVSDLKGQTNAAASIYGVTGIPDNFLIDPNGKVIARGLRGEELDKKLIEIFKSSM